MKSHTLATGFSCAKVWFLLEKLILVENDNVWINNHSDHVDVGKLNLWSWGGREFRQPWSRHRESGC